MADEFGGPIPVGPFALIGDDSIGQGIVATLQGHRSPAVLMKNHGVFTIGPSAKAAVKAAVMTEDVARTVHLSRQLGEPIPIAQADIDSLYARYKNAYGHVEEGLPRDEPVRSIRGVVPDREPEPVRRGDPAAGRRAVAAGGSRPG